jgi:hypothetical protein
MTTKKKRRTINLPLLFILVVSGAFLLPGCSSAQQQGDIPDLILRRFKAIYPNAQEASWQTIDGRYEVSFLQNKLEVAVQFLADGGVERTKVKSDVPSLPNGVADYVAQKLGGGTINSVHRIVDAYGSVTWEVMVGDVGYLFATNGELIGQLPPKANQ